MKFSMKRFDFQTIEDVIEVCKRLVYDGAEFHVYGDTLQIQVEGNVRLATYEYITGLLKDGE
jgi:hypothetical protein